MNSPRLAAALALLVLGAAPVALAQTTTPAAPKKATPAKKKGTKPVASASASASASAAPSATETASAAPPPPPPPPVVVAVEPAPAPKPPADEGIAEDAGTKYYFLGARYRGNLVPQFLMNLFVNDGATVYSNSAGVELDIRSEGHSMIPWLMYADYHTGDILFLQQGKPDDPTNYSDVKSSLAAIYAGLDELWSVPLDDGHRWEFEYGFGVGLGVVFGTLENDWVYENPNGSLAGSNGNHYTACPTSAPPPVAQPNGENPCSPAYHQNSSTTKVGGYVEPNWFNGGSTPVIFPYIAVPQFNLRYKATKDIEARLSLGFSITGFWFGLSADYGVGTSAVAPPDKADKPVDKPLPPESGDKSMSGPPALRGM